MTIDEWVYKYDTQWDIFQDLYANMCEFPDLNDALEEICIDELRYNPKEILKATELIMKVMVFAKVNDFKAVEQIYNYLNNKFHQIIA